jgi:hypothetical protein
VRREKSLIAIVDRYRAPPQRPAAGSGPGRAEFPAGAHELSRIEEHAIAELSGIRIGAGHDEHVLNRIIMQDGVANLVPPDALEMLSALKFGDE